MLHYAPLTGGSLHAAFNIAQTPLAHNTQIVEHDALRWLLSRLSDFSFNDINPLITHACSQLDPQEVVAFALQEPRLGAHLAAWRHYTETQRGEALKISGYKPTLIKRAYVDGQPVPNSAIKAVLKSDEMYFPGALLASISPECDVKLAAAAFLSVSESSHKREARHRRARQASQLLLARPDVFDELMSTTWSQRILNSHELIQMSLLNVEEPYATHVNNLMIAALDKHSFAARQETDPYVVMTTLWTILLWPRNDQRLTAKIAALLNKYTAANIIKLVEFIVPLRQQMYQRLMAQSPIEPYQDNGVEDPLANTSWPYYIKLRSQLLPNLRLTPQGWQELMGWLLVLQKSIPTNADSAVHTLRRELLTTVFHIVAPVFSEPEKVANELVNSTISVLNPLDTPKPVFDKLYKDFKVPFEDSRDIKPPRFEPPQDIHNPFNEAQNSLGEDTQVWTEFFALIENGMTIKDATVVASP